MSFVGAAYEKLQKWGFYIHAAVDGGTNFVVYATVALNKVLPHVALLVHIIPRFVHELL